MKPKLHTMLLMMLAGWLNRHRQGPQKSRPGASVGPTAENLLQGIHPCPWPRISHPLWSGLSAASNPNAWTG